MCHAHKNLSGRTVHNMYMNHFTHNASKVIVFLVKDESFPVGKTTL
jgi:esterase/lipase superfamily enzyme